MTTSINPYSASLANNVIINTPTPLGGGGSSGVQSVTSVPATSAGSSIISTLGTAVDVQTKRIAAGTGIIVNESTDIVTINATGTTVDNLVNTTDAVLTRYHNTGATSDADVTFLSGATPVQPISATSMRVNKISLNGVDMGAVFSTYVNGTRMSYRHQLNTGVVDASAIFRLTSDPTPVGDFLTWTIDNVQQSGTFVHATKSALQRFCATITGDLTNFNAVPATGQVVYFDGTEYTGTPNVAIDAPGTTTTISSAVESIVTAGTGALTLGSTTGNIDVTATAGTITTTTTNAQQSVTGVLEIDHGVNLALVIQDGVTGLGTKKGGFVAVGTTAGITGLEIDDSVTNEIRLQNTQAGGLLTMVAAASATLNSDTITINGTGLVKVQSNVGDDVEVLAAGGAVNIQSGMVSITPTSAEMKTGYSPSVPLSIATKEYVDARSSYGIIYVPSSTSNLISFWAAPTTGPDRIGSVIGAPTDILPTVAGLSNLFTGSTDWRLTCNNPVTRNYKCSFHFNSRWLGSGSNIKLYMRRNRGGVYTDLDGGACFLPVANNNREIYSAQAFIELQNADVLELWGTTTYVPSAGEGLAANTFSMSIKAL